MYKKIISVILVIGMSLSLTLTGCQKSKQDNANSQVNLKWVFLGPGEQRDSEEVWNSLNEKLAEYLPNTKLSFECVPSAEYEEKWKLMSASQENVDIVWHGWMIPYASEVKKGSYMELDDLIQKNTPEILDEIPENIMSKQRVNGKLYSIPNMQQMVSYVTTLEFPIDVYDKYKDKINTSELQNLFSSYETMDKNLWNKLEELIIMLKSGGDLRQGVFGFGDHVEKGYEWVINPYKVKENGTTFDPINIYRTPEYQTFIKVYSDWYQKGYIRKDILTADNASAGALEGKYGMQGGGNFLIGQDIIPNQNEVDMLKKQNKVATVKIPFTKDHYIPFNSSATNTAISINCKNPDRAMKLLSLMNTKKGKDIYNLLVFGIEGKHYNKVNDIEIEPIGYSSQPTSDSPYGLFKWAVGNTFNAYEIYAPNKNKLYTNEFIQNVNNNARPSRLKGFSLNTDPIKTELAQVNAVKGEFVKTLNSGAAPNAEALYAQFVEKLIKAGDDKITQEIKKQIDEWQAAN